MARLHFLLVFALLTAVTSSPAGALLINNGLAPPNPANVIDTLILEPVVVRDSGSGAPTTVELVDGGQVGDEGAERFEVFDSSSIRMSGGLVFDDILAFDTASVTVSGGVIGSGILLDDFSSIEIAAGDIGLLELLGYSSATVSGGMFDNCIIAHGSSAVVVTGGSISGCLVDDSNVGLPRASITVVGSGFAVNGTPVPFGVIPASFGTLGGLTGILASGEALDAEFRRTSADGQIILAPIPEPSTTRGALSLNRTVRLPRG